MPATLPLRIGLVILIAAAICFAANHTAARVAFDHGASVAAGVVTRATGTALFLALLMRLRGVPLALLVFQTSPMLYVLLTWALTGQAPRASAFPAMIAALVGLVLALDIRVE